MRRGRHFQSKSVTGNFEKTHIACLDSLSVDPPFPPSKRAIKAPLRAWNWSLQRSDMEHAVFSFKQKAGAQKERTPR